MLTLDMPLSASSFSAAALETQTPSSSNPWLS